MATSYKCDIECDIHEDLEFEFEELETEIKIYNKAIEYYTTDLTNKSQLIVKFLEEKNKLQKQKLIGCYMDKVIFGNKINKLNFYVEYNKKRIISDTTEINKLLKKKKISARIKVAYERM
jgi:hypothetical protein